MRTAQHLLTRTANTLNKQMEVSETQAVLALLGQGSQIKSHSFAYYGACDAVDFVSKEVYKNHLQLDDQMLHDDGDSLSVQVEDDDSFIDPDLGNIDHTDILFHPTSTTGSNTLQALLDKVGIDPTSMLDSVPKARIYTIPSSSSEPAKKIPVSYQMNYRHRGCQLSTLNRHEYFSLVGIKEEDKQTITNFFIQATTQHNILL